ncbi:MULTISPECIES: hypothetical protein [unclassified Ensifer]|uniref:hypothetical protein n=1 Tax=unclassified Ensifer TaxID=2633371 RepID=UPI001146C21B|nr:MULTISPECIES: hypothetical protein [unclassified Ensifer]
MAFASPAWRGRKWLTTPVGLAEKWQKAIAGSVVRLVPRHYMLWRTKMERDDVCDSSSIRSGFDRCVNVAILIP